MGYDKIRVNIYKWTEIMKNKGKRKSIKVDTDTWRWLALEAVKLERSIGEIVGLLVQSARKDRRVILARLK